MMRSCLVVINGGEKEKKEDIKKEYGKAQSFCSIKLSAKQWVVTTILCYDCDISL